MKLSGTIVSIASSVIVLSAALVVGLGIREIRMHKAIEKRAAVVKAEKERASRLPRTGPMARRTEQRPSPEQIRGDREDMRARFENMSDEERTQMTARFRSDGGGGPSQGRMGQFGGGMDRDAMRARFENMTEEERRAAMEEMRSRFGGGMRGGRSGRGTRGGDFGGPGGGTDGGFRRPGGGGPEGGGDAAIRGGVVGSEDRRVEENRQ